MSKANELGIIGEEIAATYLMRQGYRILHRNWNLHKGFEIDIVAMKDNELHFVEVKTRRSDRYGPPEAAVNMQKFMRMSASATYYVKYHRMTGMEYRFDAIGILYRSETDYDINFFPDIQVFTSQRGRHY